MLALHHPVHSPRVIQRRGLAAGGNDDRLPLSQVHGEIAGKEGQIALGDNNTVRVQAVPFLFALPLIIFYFYFPR